jgi:hypothetical protein
MSFVPCFLRLFVAADYVLLGGVCFLLIGLSLFYTGLFRGLFRRVKLVPAEELREQLALVKQSLHRALYASRILRFSQPTQFSLNLSFFAIFIAIIAS